MGTEAGAPLTGEIALLQHADGELAGGVPRVQINLASAFVRRDIPTTLVVTGSISRTPVGLDPRVRVEELGKRNLRGAFWPLVAYLRRARPSAVVSAMEHPNVLALAARSAARAPLHLTLCTHGNLSSRLKLLYGRRDRLILSRAVRHAYPRADVLIAPSQGVADDLSALIGAPHVDVLTIPNPIVDDTFAARMQAPLAHPWLEDAAVPVFLTAGRLNLQKDHRTLIRALALARRSRDARLIVLGEGGRRVELETLADELAVRSAIEFVGNVDDPLPYMRRADAFVLSSLWEGFGNVLVESLACGCPVVSTDCPSGPAEVLGDGAWGRLVPVGDERALADAMLATLAAEPDPARLVVRANDFRVDEIASRYLEAIGAASTQPR